MARGGQEKVRVGADATCAMVKRVINVGLTDRKWLSHGTKRAEARARLFQSRERGEVDLNGEDAFQTPDEGSPVIVVRVQP